MSDRILDIRLTAEGRRALVELSRTLRLGRPGDVLRTLAAMGVRVEAPPTRQPLTERMRATVDPRMADDLKTLAEFFGITLERQVDALLRAGLEHVRTPPCATASTPSTTTTASSRTTAPSTTRDSTNRPGSPSPSESDAASWPSRAVPCAS